MANISDWITRGLLAGTKNGTLVPEYVAQAALNYRDRKMITDEQLAEIHTSTPMDIATREDVNHLVGYLAGHAGDDIDDAPITEAARAQIAAIRDTQDNVIALAAETPKIINAMAATIREWEPAVYEIGQVRQYNGIPYKCIQAHDSTPNPDWTPDAVPALWMQYHGTSIGTARPWIAPQGAHDMYRMGEYMIWTDGSIQRCVQDTDRGPDVRPEAWEVAVPAASETEEPEPGGEDEPTEPVDDEYPPWAPYDGTNAYREGAKVTHSGKRWISGVDNNTYEPGAPGVYDNVWRESE